MCEVWGVDETMRTFASIAMWVLIIGYFLFLAVLFFVPIWISFRSDRRRERR